MLCQEDSLINKGKIVQNDTIKQKIFSGVVTDEAGIPLPGANVLIKNTVVGTTTDFDGEFSISGKVGDTLVISYIGYSSVEAVLGIENILDIALIDSSDSLAEVVVVVAVESEEEELINIPCLTTKRLFSEKKYDSRFEKTQLDSSIAWQSSILKQAESVAIIVEKERLNAISHERFQIDVSNTLHEIYNLCSDQIFAEQSVIGVGTGFIVSENSMITAKHVFEEPIQNYAVIFGYEIIDTEGGLKSQIDASNVYIPTKIDNQSDELDVIKFTVDRAFDRPSLEWENSLDLNINDIEIYMIGYPSGLPLKIALNAGIVENSPFQYFYTSLDGFQGNSGSPVFNLCTNKVIGILVSGEIDYQFNGNCYETTICKYPQCKGEKVIRIESVMEEFK